MQGVVLDVHRLVGAHLQGLADRGLGLLRPDREDRHAALALAVLAQLERLLNGVLVELAQQAVDADPVGRVVGRAEGALRLGVRDVLDADHDVHEARGYLRVTGGTCSFCGDLQHSPQPARPRARCGPVEASARMAAARERSRTARPGTPAMTARSPYRPRATACAARTEPAPIVVPRRTLERTPSQEPGPIRTGDFTRPWSLIGRSAGSSVG